MWAADRRSGRLTGRRRSERPRDILILVPGWACVDSGAPARVGSARIPRRPSRCHRHPRATRPSAASLGGRSPLVGAAELVGGGGWVDALVGAAAGAGGAPGIGEADRPGDRAQRRGDLTGRDGPCRVEDVLAFGVEAGGVALGVAGVVDAGDLAGAVDPGTGGGADVGGGGGGGVVDVG